MDFALQENFGLDLIEVRDNGHGISPSEAYHAALAHYTSKLRRHEDLQHVSSYGFRGEALSSLCCVSQVKITSRTVQEEVAQQYSLDGQGHILSAKVCFQYSTLKHQFHSTCGCIAAVMQHKFLLSCLYTRCWIRVVCPGV